MTNNLSDSWTNYFVAYYNREGELWGKIVEAECEETAKITFSKMGVEHDRIFFIRNFWEMFG
jgi:hypothetical protein